jgi:hypothetical protein
MYEEYGIFCGRVMKLIHAKLKCIDEEYDIDHYEDDDRRICGGHHDTVGLFGFEILRFEVAK